MINEFEFFHGVVFARMLHATQRELSIRPHSASDNAAYVLDDSKGVYIKYSSKRLSPWRFSFQKRHQEAILEMKESFGEVFLLLVCNDDGVIVLTFAELKQILDEHHETVEWISATRNRRQMYSIKGTDGKLHFKVGRDEFHKIFMLEKEAAPRSPVEALPRPITPITG